MKFGLFTERYIQVQVCDGPVPAWADKADVKAIFEWGKCVYGKAKGQWIQSEVDRARRLESRLGIQRTGSRASPQCGLHVKQHSLDLSTSCIL